MPNVRAHGIDIAYESCRPRRRSGDPDDQGAQHAADGLARFALQRAGGAGLSRHPVRQSRRRPFDPPVRARRAGPCRDDGEGPGGRARRRALRARRHGFGRSRAPRRARDRLRPYRRLLDGRHDRAARRDLPSGKTGASSRSCPRRGERPSRRPARGDAGADDLAQEPEPRRSARTAIAAVRAIGSPGFRATDAELTASRAQHRPHAFRSAGRRAPDGGDCGRPAAERPAEDVDDSGAGHPRRRRSAGSRRAGEDTARASRARSS